MAKINLSSIRGVFKGAPTVPPEARVAKLQTRVAIYIEAEKQPVNNRIWNTGKIGLAGFVGFEAALALLDQMGGLGAGSGLKNSLGVGSPFAAYLGLGSSSLYLLGKAAAQKIRLFGIVRSFGKLETVDQQGMIEYASKEAPQLAKALKLKMRGLARAQEEALGKIIKPAEHKAVEPAKPAALPKQEDIAQKLRNFEEAINGKDKTIAALQAETIKLAQIGSERLETVKRELEAKLAQKQCQMDEMGKQLESLTREGSQMATKVAQMNEEITGLRTANEKLLKDNEALNLKVREQDNALKAMHENFDKKGKAEIDRLTAAIKAIENRMTAEINKKNTKIAELEAEKEQMQAQMATLKQERDGLAKEVGGLKGQVFNLTQSLESGDAESKGIRVTQEAEIQRLKFEIQRLYGEKITAGEKGNQSADQITQLLGKVDALMQEVGNKDKAMSELRAERERLTSETTQTASEFRKGMDMLAQKAKEEISKRDEEIRKLKEDLSKEASEKIRQLEAEKEELAARMKDMEAGHKAKISTLEAQLAASGTQVPVKLQIGAAGPTESWKEVDEILAKLNSLSEDLEEIRGTGQPKGGLGDLQLKLSLIAQTLVSFFTRARETFLDHQRMLSEIEKLQQIKRELVQGIAKLNTDAQKYDK